MLSTTGLARRVKAEEVTSAHSTGEDTTEIPHPDVLKSSRRPQRNRKISKFERGMTDSYHLQSIAATSFLPLQTTKKVDTGLKPVTYRRCFEYYHSFFLVSQRELEF